MTPNATACLIDGSHFIHRAFNGMPEILTSSGEQKAVIISFYNLVKKAMDSKRFSHVVVTFDHHGKNFRHALLPSYKAARPEKPEALLEQERHLIDVLPKLGVTTIVKAGVEADDVIGTLAMYFNSIGYAVEIYTGDKDFSQLVSDTITLFNPMGNKRVGIEEVKNKFGIEPSKVAEVLALSGDKSDGIDGVPGIGTTTAANLLNQYGSINGIVDHIDEVKGKRGKVLKENIDSLPLFLKLTTIDCNVDLPLDESHYLIKPADPDSVNAFLSRFELRGAPVKPEQSKPASHESKITLTKEMWMDWFSAALSSKQLYLCLPEGSTVLSLLTDDDKGVALTESKLKNEVIINDLKHILNDPLKIKVTIDSKRVIQFLASHGFNVVGLTHDVGIQAYVINSRDQLVLTHPEAIKQAHLTQWPIILNDSVLLTLYRDLDLPLVSVLREMEAYGVRVDKSHIQGLDKQALKKMTSISEAIFKMTKGPFNISSPREVGAALNTYNKVTSAKGGLAGGAVDAGALNLMAEKGNVLASKIIDYRKVAKIKSAYTESLPKFINTQGEIHTTFHQARAVTGRITSTDPCLLNIPVKSAIGRRLREAFLPKSPNRSIVSMDYSQIDLKVMAHLSQDKALINAFNLDSDIHKGTASELFSVPVTDVTEEQRRYAKEVNFGLIFGISAAGLSKKLGITPAKAQGYIDNYFARYPDVYRYMNGNKAFAKEHGYIETLLGRRIYLPDIKSGDTKARHHAERLAINGAVQGSSAEIIKMAMLSLSSHIKNTGSDMKMMMQVYDEIVLDVPDAEVERLSNLAAMMENAATLVVPLTVDIGIGKNWSEAH